MNNTTVEYSRRDKDGYKNTTIKTETWHASVTDMQQGERNWASLSIHANLVYSDHAVIAVQDHSDAANPFFSINIGNGCGPSVFLSPDQARTLQDLLGKAMEGGQGHEPGHRLYS